MGTHDTDRSAADRPWAAEPEDDDRYEYECRQCGDSLSKPYEACPLCGGDVAVYPSE